MVAPEDRFLTYETRALQRNYDFLPDGYGDLLVMTESLDAIMADKLISLSAVEKISYSKFTF